MKLNLQVRIYVRRSITFFRNVATEQYCKDATRPIDYRDPISMFLDPTVNDEVFSFINFNLTYVKANKETRIELKTSHCKMT